MANSLANLVPAKLPQHLLHRVVAGRADLLTPAPLHRVDPAQVRAGYLGSLAARSALCALPLEALEALDALEALENATPDEQTVAMFARRMKLTRAMLEMATQTTDVRR